MGVCWHTCRVGRGLHPVDETAKVSGLVPTESRWRGSRGFLLATSGLITLVCLLTKGLVSSGSGGKPESSCQLTVNLRMGKKKGCVTHATTGMNLENILPNEISQITHILGP